MFLFVSATSILVWIITVIQFEYARLLLNKGRDTCVRLFFFLLFPNLSSTLWENLFLMKMCVQMCARWTRWTDYLFIYLAGESTYLWPGWWVWQNHCWPIANWNWQQSCASYYFCSLSYHYFFCPSYSLCCNVFFFSCFEISFWGTIIYYYWSV